MDRSAVVLITPMRCLAPLIVVSILSTPAFAQLEEVGEEPASEALVEARDTFKKGVKLAKKGMNDEAIAAFEEALPELGREGGSDIFYNLVNVARVKRDWRRVVLYAHGFLARESGTKDAAEVEKMKEFALGRLELRTPAGQLVIEAPESAVVFIDHTPIKGRKLALARGRYTVTAELVDHLPVSAVVVVGEEKAQLALAPKPANYTGFITIKSTPADGVTVFVDDKSIGRTPLSGPIELPVGKRLVRFEKAGFDTWSRYIDVLRGKTEDLEPRLEKTP